MSVEQCLIWGFNCSAPSLRKLDNSTGPVDVSTTVTGGMVKVVEIVLAKVSQLLASYSEALQNISKWLKRMPWMLLLTSSHPSANLDLEVSTEVFVRHLCHLAMESLSSLWTKCHLDVDPDLVAVLSSVDHNGLNAGEASDRRSSTSDWQSSLIGLACLVQVVGQMAATPEIRRPLTRSKSDRRKERKLLINPRSSCWSDCGDAERSVPDERYWIL